MVKRQGLKAGSLKGNRWPNGNRQALRTAFEGAGPDRMSMVVVRS